MPLGRGNDADKGAASNGACFQYAVSDGPGDGSHVPRSRGRPAHLEPRYLQSSGRSFRAKLKIAPREDEPTKWKVDFDEEWAKEPPKEQEEAGEAAA